MATFLFVGERPSRRAVEIGATWQNGRLAAKTLHDALRANGIDPTGPTVHYLNLWDGAEPHDGDLSEEQKAVAEIGRWQSHLHGAVVVGMGNLVSTTLSRYGIEHRRMVHPAARGRIRGKSVYIAHVGEVLGRQVA